MKEYGEDAGYEVQQKKGQNFTVTIGLNKKENRMHRQIFTGSSKDLDDTSDHRSLRSRTLLNTGKSGSTECSFFKISTVSYF